VQVYVGGTVPVRAPGCAADPALQAVPDGDHCAAVRDGDEAWLRSEDCQELIDLIGLDLLAGHYRVGFGELSRVPLDRQAVSHATHKVLTAEYRYPAPGPSILRGGRGDAAGEGGDDQRETTPALRSQPG
jgi:hypothetical protein